METKDIAQEWFKIAETDLSSAQFLQTMQPLPIEIICYHCQQSAEKYLKGFLALLGEGIKKTHDLVQLNKICQKYDKDFIKIGEDCLLLTDYGVKIRYPFPMDIDESDMETALKRAQEIKVYVLKKAAQNDEDIENSHS